MSTYCSDVCRRRRWLSGALACVASMALAIGCGASEANDVVAGEPGDGSTSTSQQAPDQSSSTTWVVPPSSTVSSTALPPVVLGSTTDVEAARPSIVAGVVSSGESEALANCVADSLPSAFQGPELAFAIAVLALSNAPEEELVEAIARSGIDRDTTGALPDRVGSLFDGCRSVDVSIAIPGSIEPGEDR